ncbi:MAG: hypothetical protein H6809_03335, partial [Phycisphaeraceae bacterium]|nr:hypothetical protein [Phycisphaeraceae bacterium]
MIVVHAAFVDGSLRLWGERAAGALAAVGSGGGTEVEAAGERGVAAHPYAAGRTEFADALRALGVGGEAVSN